MNPSLFVIWVWFFSIKVFALLQNVDDWDMWKSHGIIPPQSCCPVIQLSPVNISWYGWHTCNERKTHSALSSCLGFDMWVIPICIFIIDETNKPLPSYLTVHGLGKEIRAGWGMRFNLQRIQKLNKRTYLTHFGNFQNCNKSIRLVIISLSAGNSSQLEDILKERERN